MSEDWFIRDCEKNGTTTNKHLCRIIRTLQAEVSAKNEVIVKLVQSGTLSARFEEGSMEPTGMGH